MLTGTALGGCSAVLLTELLLAMELPKGEAVPEGAARRDEILEPGYCSALPLTGLVLVMELPKCDAYRCGSWLLQCLAVLGPQ